MRAKSAICDCLVVSVFDDDDDDVHICRCFTYSLAYLLNVNCVLWAEVVLRFPKLKKNIQLALATCLEKVGFFISVSCMSWRQFCQSLLPALLRVKFWAVWSSESVVVSPYNSLRNRLPVGGGCVYVLQMFFLFFLFYFTFFPSIKNMRQPFSGTAERIIMKLLPDDSWENEVSNAISKWGLGPRIIFWG